MLLIDQNAGAAEAGLDSQGHDMFVELHGAIADLAHLEGHPAAGAGKAEQFPEHCAHHRLPVFQGIRHGDVFPHFLRIDPVEPAAQPVIGGVLHHVEEGRGGDGQLY